VTPNPYAVYLLWDPRNGNIRYVGRTRQLKYRLRAHQGGYVSKSPCRNWEISLIAEGLSCEASIVESNLSADQADVRERWWIAYGRNCGWDLTNASRGGTGGQEVSNETREKLRQSHLGHALSAKVLKNFVHGNKGRRMSPDACEKIRQANLGKRLSPETRQKVRQARVRYWAMKREEEGEVP
jgi:hypothetical protein